MLFEKRLQDGLRDGSISLAFRRWRRPQVLAGRRYRSPVGMVEISSVTTVDEDDIAQEDVEQAGFVERAALLKDLQGPTGETTIYRIELRLGEAPDPRAVLAAAETLSHEEIRQLDVKLARLDREREWTRATLEAIARQPGRRAGDLADQLGWPALLEFKLHVRQLKGLGLTLSLPIGYQLSPRGQAYLAATRLATRSVDLDSVAGPSATSGSHAVTAARPRPAHRAQRA